MTAAEGLVTAHNVKINAQKTLVAKLDAAVTEHTTEEGLMVTALNDATTAATTAATNVTTATNAKTAFETARAKTTAPKGTGKLLIDATADATAKATAFNTATTELATALGEYKTALMAFDKDTRMKADYLVACNNGGVGSVNCINEPNSPILALYTGANTSLSTTTTTKGTKLGVWNGKVTALATAQDNKN